MVGMQRTHRRRVSPMVQGEARRQNQPRGSTQMASAFQRLSGIPDEGCDARAANHRAACYPSPVRDGHLQCSFQPPANEGLSMTASNDDILDGLFHAAAWAAYIEQAQAEQGWPDPEATRRRAFSYY